jgi:hypothetical protein
MLIGYRCPAGGEQPGRNNSIDYCLGTCKNPCVSPPLLAAMFKADTGNYHNDSSYISASMLAGTNCPRQTLWERTEDFYDLPRKRYWPFRGTHAHTICEGAGDLLAKYGWVQEIRTECTLNYPDVAAPIFDENGVFTGQFSETENLKIKVRGTGDAYNPFVLPRIADMKSMADKKATMVITGTKGGTFSKNLDDTHVWQFNIYRYLFSKTPIPDELREQWRSYGLPELKGKNFPAPKELVMQGIGMMDIPRSGATYPITDRGRTTLYDIDPVPVLPLKEIEAFMKEKALFWYRHLVLRIPAPVLPESKKWMCKGCAFNGEIVPGERCFPDAERKALKESTANLD